MHPTKLSTDFSEGSIGYLLDQVHRDSTWNSLCSCRAPLVKLVYRHAKEISHYTLDFSDGTGSHLYMCTVRTSNNHPYAPFVSRLSRTNPRTQTTYSRQTPFQAKPRSMTCGVDGSLFYLMSTVPI